MTRAELILLIASAIVIEYVIIGVAYYRGWRRGIKALNDHLERSGSRIRL